MRVEWYGQSAFRFIGGDATAFIDPIGDVASLGSRGIQFDYPPIDGVQADLVFTLDGVRVARFGDFGQSSLREERASAIGEVDLLIIPVGDGPTIGAAQATAIVERLRPRWVVPMHFRTPADRVHRDRRHVPRADGAREEARGDRVRHRRARGRRRTAGGCAGRSVAATA
jgi:L-ascorbate metabolism protein UlaG (beta-lactamase superfamily)